MNCTESPCALGAADMHEHDADILGLGGVEDGLGASHLGLRGDTGLAKSLIGYADRDDHGFDTIEGRGRRLRIVLMFDAGSAQQRFTVKASSA